MLERKESQKYQHYKGGIYYKLADSIIGDDYTDYGAKIFGEATFESTLEPMLILSGTEDYKCMLCFKDRDSTMEEFLQDVILYQSQKDGMMWVRLKKDFEADIDENTKRFTHVVQEG